MYKLQIKFQGTPEFVLNTETNTFIPFDEANSDYQAYLKWLDAGNTPLPADEQPQG